MQAKREKNHNNSNHAPISTFTHNKIRPLPPVRSSLPCLKSKTFETIENAKSMRNGKKKSRPSGLLLFCIKKTTGNAGGSKKL